MYLKTFVVVTASAMCLLVNPIYAAGCQDISTIVSKAKEVRLVPTNILDKKYVSSLLQHAAEFDQKIRAVEYRQCEKTPSAMVQIDKVNTDVLVSLMGAHTWFTPNAFDAPTSNAAWMIAIHSKDINLQHKVLFLMERLIANGEYAGELESMFKGHYALLYDCVSLNYVNMGIKQKYGSQYIISDKDQKLTPKPCEGTRAEVDRRRRDNHMRCLDAYEKELKSVYFS